MHRPVRTAAALLALVLLAPALSSGPAFADYGRDPYTPVTLQPLTFVPTMGAPVADGNGGTYVAWSADGERQQRHPAPASDAQGRHHCGLACNGLVVYAAATGRGNPKVMSDGSGGVFVAWEDSRGATTDIYALRFLANGSLAGGWPSSGLLVSTTGLSASHADGGASMAPDGLGGAFIVWTLTFASNDVDVYGAHVSSSGVVAWSFALYQPGGRQTPAKTIGDGAGGFYVAFTDDEAGSVVKGKVQRFASNGVSAWAPVAIGTGLQQYGIDICSDGGTGAYAVAADNGPGSYTNISGNHFLSSWRERSELGRVQVSRCPVQYQSGFAVRGAGRKRRTARLLLRPSLRLARFVRAAHRRLWNCLCGMASRGRRAVHRQWHSDSERHRARWLGRGGRGVRG